MATEPTAEQCSANEPVSADGRDGFAIWYPQMGGYVGKAIVLPDDDCFEVLVWHDGEFPFPGTESGDAHASSPVLLHHCNPGQFIAFGETVRRLLGDS